MRCTFGQSIQKQKTGIEQYAEADRYVCHTLRKNGKVHTLLRWLSSPFHGQYFGLLPKFGTFIKNENNG